MKRKICAALAMMLAWHAPSFGQNYLETLTKRLEPDVEHLRGLTFQRDIEKTVQNAGELRAVLDRELARAYPGDALRHLEQRLLKFGFVVSPVDLRQMYLQLFSQQIAGYYDPITQKMVLVTNEGGGGAQGTPLMMQLFSNWIVRQFGLTMDEILLAHELTHVLQDQHFRLMSLPLEDARQEDMGSAAKALVEGDAMLVMVDYMLRAQAPGMDATQAPDISANMRNWSNHPLVRAMSVSPSFPRYLTDNLFFSYIDGFDFVLHLKKQGGWNAVNQAYAHPPASTEQILHPEKYQDQPDAPTILQLPDFSAELPGWDLIETNTLGEFNIRLLLDGFLSSADAVQASAGWGGDRFALYEERQSGQLLLAWVTAWDSKRDAKEFFRLYGKMLEKRYAPDAPHGKSADAPPNPRSWQTGAGTVWLERKGNRVLLFDGAADTLAPSFRQKLWNETIITPR